MSKDNTTLLVLAAAAAVGYYFWSQSQAGAGTAAVSMLTPTPLSIYPEYGYTAQTSMAATPYQKAPAAVITPVPLYTAVQSQEQGAVLGQCVGSYPGCTVMMADTQLGL